jgi:hypothetical protein
MDEMPRRRAPGLQFSLRSLVYVTALVALFYGLRRGYLMTAFDLAETIERARNVPTLVSLAAALSAAVFLQGSTHRKSSQSCWLSLWRGAILGAGAGALSCLALAIEFGEGLRRIEYWNWSQDWLLVLPYFVVATIQGAAIGAFVLQIGRLLRTRTSRTRTPC